MRIFSLPCNRVALFARDGGALLEEVAERGNVELKLNGEGDVEISGNGGDEWIAEQVLLALSYGFKPRNAFKLFGDDAFIEVIDLGQACNHSDKLVAKCKSRVIGSQGKAKKRVEELSGAFISVQDDCVAMLGTFEDLKMAKEAVFRIIEGAEHSSVYAFLEARRRRLKERELLK